MDSISEFNEGNGYQNKITVKHIVLGYKGDDKTISCNNSCQQVYNFPSTNRIINLKRKANIPMFIAYLSMNKKNKRKENTSKLYIFKESKNTIY